MSRVWKWEALKPSQQQAFLSESQAYLTVTNEEIECQIKDIQCTRDRELVAEALRMIQQRSPPITYDLATNLRIREVPSETTLKSGASSTAQRSKGMLVENGLRSPHMAQLKALVHAAGFMQPGSDHSEVEEYFFPSSRLLAGDGGAFGEQEKRAERAESEVLRGTVPVESTFTQEFLIAHEVACKAKKECEFQDLSLVSPFFSFISITCFCDVILM